MALNPAMISALGGPALPSQNAGALGMRPGVTLAQAPVAPPQESDAGQMPEIGVLPGKLFLNPSTAPQVNGPARPFGPGEYIQNPNGSWSSEITTTTSPGTYPALNGGAPTVIPTLWIIDGKPTRVDEDTAAEFAVRSGLKFPSFNTPDEAEAYSVSREGQWQNVEPQNSSSVPSLWSVPTPGGQ